MREAVIRIVVPLDPSRYLELPAAAEALGARPGQRVLDLASPKLLAVHLARGGLDVVSVDLLREEVERWRALTVAEPRVRFAVADGRALPFADQSFDHAYSVSVLEHIPEGGEQALRELARVVRGGGRVFVTLPFAEAARDEWRARPLYGDGEGPSFFQRWYDRPAVERLVSSAPTLTLERLEVVRMAPNWNSLYTRHFPLLVPLGPFFGLLAGERRAPDGDVVRLTFTRTVDDTA